MQHHQGGNCAVLEPDVAAYLARLTLCKLCQGKEPILPGKSQQRGQPCAKRMPDFSKTVFSPERQTTPNSNGPHRPKQISHKKIVKVWIFPRCKE
eukprot:4590319-Amphidinium_carterae.2